MKMKSEKSKAKGVNMQEPSESGTRVRVPPPQIDPKDKGKMTKARLEREREVEAIKAANIAECDDLAAGSSKRDAEEELDQESSKRKKTGESSELAEKPIVKEADELSQEELQQMMIIVPEQGMNVEALQTKYPIIDWEIYTEGTRKYWKITIVGNHTEKGIDIYMLVEKEYPLSRGTLTLMLVAKLLVDQDNEMSRELLRKIFMQGRIVGIKRLLSAVEVNAASYDCYYCWFKLQLLEDASKQGRNEDQDEDISWFQEDVETQGRYGQDIEVTTASAPITTVGVSVSTAKPSTPPTITTLIEDEDLTIAQTLMKMRSEKTKEKLKEKSKEK
ncbi:hypothetical protein Tco_0711746 [Tanacetum coccineum]